jgi:uncharacterized protein YgbK (DUF1537 family)
MTRASREKGGLLAMTTVIVDDDPTGTQTLRGVELLFGVEDELLRDRLTAGASTVCVLTNSRALSRDEAHRANARIAAILRDHAGTRPLLVSRGDSTLRGHLTAETAALTHALDAPAAEVRRVFVPAFVQAGRTTRGGRHYVEINGEVMPASATPFADDARFGYSESSLADYLVEVGAVMSAGDVQVVDLESVRSGGTAEALRATASEWSVVDAEHVADIDAIASALLALHAEGVALLVRCAPSLVGGLVGGSAPAALSDAELRNAFPTRDGHGLVVAGSHVPQTARQLAALAGEPGIYSIEIAVDVLADENPAARADPIDRIIAALADSDVVLSTPRTEIRDSSAGGAMAKRFSDSLSEIVTAVAQRYPLAWVIAKGGITSHETAARGLGIRAAVVVGQLFDSKVSVIRPTVAPAATIGLPYVIFPGNVGRDDDLRVALHRMRTLTSKETS